MKPYKNPRKYEWICPFSSCREKFYSGGLGHLDAQACGHLRNKHHRHLDTGFIWRTSYLDKELRLPDNVPEPIWESEFWKRKKSTLSRMKSFVFRVRKRYFDAIKSGEKTVEYRRASPFWKKRLLNLLNLDLHKVAQVDKVDKVAVTFVAVFMCGQRVHRRRITRVMFIPTPESFSEEGRKDVDTPMCFAIYLGEEIKKKREVAVFPGIIGVIKKGEH